LVTNSYVYAFVLQLFVIQNSSKNSLISGEMPMP